MSETRPPIPERPRSPETHVPSFDECVEHMRTRAALYFADRDSDARRTLLKETERVHMESESPRTTSAAYSERKKIPAHIVELNRYWLIEALKINHGRVNEDVVRVGKNWHVVADGVTNHERNLCALMGEAFSLAWGRACALLEQMRPQPNAESIRIVLALVPTQARRIVTEAMRGYSATDHHYADLDLSTTVEAVYTPEWLDSAFVLHIGDSRTYHVKQDSTVACITTDHSQEDQGGRKYINSSLSPEREPPSVDILEVRLEPDEALVSLTDGVFTSVDMTTQSNQPSRTILTIGRAIVGVDTLTETAEWIVQSGIHAQEGSLYFDDTSCAITQRKR